MIKIRKWMSNIKGYIKLKFFYIKKYFGKKYLVYPVSVQKHSNYRDLAPEDELSESEYFSALDWALNNEKVMNIAIAGPYGSGKSSIIKSYIKKHPELKFINISLANFIEHSPDGSEQLIDFKDDDLEVGILKQLFYKVDYKKIPQSRYRKLHSIKKKNIFGYTTIFAILIILFCMFFVEDMKSYIFAAIQKAVNNSGLKQPWIVILGVGLILGSIYVVSHLVWKIVSRVKIKEVNLADSAMTATTDNSESESSIFNKNLDEIVYFFEETKYDVVFIEDLDRFNCSSIFVKLRELNTILNQYDVIKKRIVFIYAIKDDMFSEKERTKFFEYIIPVIPIINATNSGEKLLEKLRDKGENKIMFDISMEYITLIAPYIDDMRVLTNICNEFITYKYTLQEEQELKLSDQLMFSLMVFKNLYPKDFANLQAEKGVVKEAFRLKKEKTLKLKKEYDNKIKNIEKDIELVDNDILSNVAELKSAMLYYMTGNNGMFYYFNTNGSNIFYNTIMEDEFDLDNLRTKGTVTYYYNGNNTTNCVFDGKERFTGANDYISRCNNIIRYAPVHRETLMKEIEIENVQIHKLNSSSLKNMLENFDEVDILPQDVRDNRLLCFLLRKGYIDEKYPNYMNYFHANSITKGDMNFILSIRNREAETFNYELSQIEQLVKRLLPYEFEQKEIYNFDLLDFLLTHEDNRDKLLFFIKQLSDESDISWEFINEYIKISSELEKFFELLGKTWKNLWNYIYLKETLTNDAKETYFELICKYVKVDDIVKLNSENNFSKFIEENNHFFTNLDDVTVEKKENIIEVCKVMFYELDTNSTDDNLINWIFDNNYYLITISLLNSIIIHKNKDKVEGLLTANYTTLNELKYLPLLNYINDEFINVI